METLTTNNVISKFKNFNNEHGNIKTLIKSFLSEANTMAIKQNQSKHESANGGFDMIYSTFNNPPSQPNHRTSIKEAKRAFLNSTVNSATTLSQNKPTENPAIHYAQLAMVTDNEDSRSTGGGKVQYIISDRNNQKENLTSVKSVEQKKVSFKVRPASTSYRKPPMSTKTVTISNTKVSELTKKFNSLIEESKIEQTICSTVAKIPSIASSPSSTLSSSPNIKIVLRQKRGNRKRGKKKRCSSMDDIENTSVSSKTSVTRSKSDGVKFRKSKRRLKYESSENNSGTDSNDSNNSKNNKNKRAENKIRNVIKKFEFEIIAQTNPNFNSLKKQMDKKKEVATIKEKPKVPEKKSTLSLTKNVVVKDGVPKIKVIKPTGRVPVNLESEKHAAPEISIKKKKEKYDNYDKLKFKTNYIHSERLPLKAVEIIHEDINETSVCNNFKEMNDDSTQSKSQEISEKLHQDDLTCINEKTSLNVDPKDSESHRETNIIISPNNSFLWRHSDNISEKLNVCNDGTKTNPINCSPIYEKINLDEKRIQSESENNYDFNRTVINIDNTDFESNLVEAVNKVLVPDDDDDDYEPLAPRDLNNVVIIPVRTVDRKSKMNCPLPEIPQSQDDQPARRSGKDYYQRLIEMRSHPEGDDSSLHNYEECENRYEERTRGDGDSDDGYEYCRTQLKPYCLMSSNGIQIAESYKPVPPKARVTKSASNASTVSYEQIGSAREITITQQSESKASSNQSWPSHTSSESNITVYNDSENIYDTVKLSDSTSHCYESVPSSPSIAKMRPNFRKQLASAVRKRLSLDSQSTVTSDQRTNSIYGQRSSYSGQDVGFAVPSSESGSDRSDDWVDLSDDEKQTQYSEQKIIIVQERGRGKKSPLSWSQKVRHQWHRQPVNVNEDKVMNPDEPYSIPLKYSYYWRQPASYEHIAFTGLTLKSLASAVKAKKVSVTSPTKVHILTSEKSPFFSRNDELVRRIRSLWSGECIEEVVRVIDVRQHVCWVRAVTSFQDGEVETQENVAFIESDGSDFGHLYESLGPPAQVTPAPAPAIPPTPYDEDFDSFDSDSDFDNDSNPKITNLPRFPSTMPDDLDVDSFDSTSEYERVSINPHHSTFEFRNVSDYKSPTPASIQPPIPLPSPPSSGPYTLSKIANAAQRKMRQLKRNLTKKYVNGVDGHPKPPPTTTAGIYDSFKNLYKSTYKSSSNSTSSQRQEEVEHIYSNLDIISGEARKTDSPLRPNGFKEELMTVLGEKRPSSADNTTPPPRPSLPPPALIERISAENTSPGSPPQITRKDKDPGTLRKIKSRFRRAASIATDMDADVPSVLKITNSTFYLTDSMDSGFSNCSDSGPGECREPAAPVAPSRQRDGKLRHWSESTPCLAPLPRPAVPPPPPPLSPVNVTATPVTVTPPSPAPASPTDPQLSAINEELKRLLPTLRKDKEKERRSRTSWYAEAGELHIGNSSWYSEIGLYPAGNISSSSGASSGSHPASPLPRSLFNHEPLYQFYNAAKVESQCREGDSDSDAYETGPTPAEPAAEGAGGGVGGSAGSAGGGRSPAMALVGGRGPARSLWCEVAEVRASAVLSSLSPQQKRLQEAKFELLTSEASYLNSLNVLESHFISHPAFRDSSVLSREERELLFGTILPVKRCSQQLMVALERCWQENILLTGICGVVRRHADAQFAVYVRYCEAQAAMVRALHRAREKPAFAATLRRLESHPACQSLSLHSFLMLPMQRVTRLPLLMDAVLKNLAPGDEEYDSCMHALAVLNHYVSQCNEGARNTERIEEMYRLSQRIEFPPHMENAPVIGPACGRRDRKPVRWLVRSGEMTHLVWKAADEIKLTFGKKFHKIPLHLFLFNDLLVITKKKGEDSYVAIDWCWRALLAVSSSDVTAAAKHALLLTLLEDSRGRTQEMLMSCESETCVSRWVEALTPVSSDGGEAVYAGWDCPQVHALYCYAAAQPDELSLEQGDIVNVTRKTSEGWYYGERTRDGAAGWFPGAYCAEIMSAHVRARNLRQRYRLLALSGTYLGHRRRN